MREALTSVGKWEKTSSMAKAVFSSSGEAAISLSSDKSLDAIFIWDSVARQFDLRIHQFKEFENASEGMYAILGKNTKNRTHSLQFARFLAADDLLSTLRLEDAVDDVDDAVGGEHIGGGHVEDAVEEDGLGLDAPVLADQDVAALQREHPLALRGAQP